MDYSKFFRQATGLVLIGALAIGCTKDDAGTDGTDSSIMISPSIRHAADTVPPVPGTRRFQPGIEIVPPSSG